MLKLHCLNIVVVYPESREFVSVLICSSATPVVWKSSLVKAFARSLLIKGFIYSPSSDSVSRLLRLAELVVLVPISSVEIKEVSNPKKRCLNGHV